MPRRTSSELENLTDSVLILRMRGFSYRKIGSYLQINFTWARALTLRGINSRQHETIAPICLKQSSHTLSDLSL